MDFVSDAVRTMRLKNLSGRSGLENRRGRRKDVLDLCGAVALLLWGVRMVKTGVMRAFGPRLRLWIGSAVRNRVAAFGVGIAATIVLQSSTATAMMAASFTAGGFMSSMMAQAIMLGANIGTGIVTRLLVFDIHFLAPLLIATGVVSFSFSHSKPLKGFCRALLGLGMMLLSLQLLGQATEPMRHAKVLTALMAALEAVPVLAVAVAAVLAAAASSSMAIVLLAMSLATADTVSPMTGLALVLGANLGGAIPPLVATLRHQAAARRVTFGNLLVRLLGCILLLPFIETVSALLSKFAVDPGLFVADAHILFNISIAAIMLPLLRPWSMLMRKILPDAPGPRSGPLHLDAECLDSPALALAGAARETLAIGDRIASMLEMSLEALRINDISRCASIADMDDEIDRLNSAVKLYLARLDRPRLNIGEADRSDDIIGYATNLEHVGDIIDRNLCELVEKKIRNQLSFSSEGAAEIEEIYNLTFSNLRMAQSILLSMDDHLARKLVKAKVDIRHLEERSAANHMSRLREGIVESIQTSSLHMDMLRDLKRINAHIAAIAYPILKRHGLLRESRVVAVGTER
ncbi:Na/Pi cotransporter family protein [Chelatococcus asaccharovorans]|uniref:Na/Pi cotransporter family protein n=1 Tax=Chelatococcus asaccharovorans TaxID=28210 RepID=UPI001FE0A6A7|nr:Na/Pi cotransporter family protein [Chelatococcus asaccharovorans]